MRRRHVSDYLLSVPERTLRSASALAGGLLREAGDVAVPSFLRRTRLYRTLVDSTLRFLIEQVGRVEGTYPNEEKLAENFLLRRTAGNGLELVSVLAFHASPVWVLAALADISGAGRQLIHEIAAALKQEGLLAPDAEVNTAEQMLDAIERVSGRAAEMVNTPPLDVAALRKEWAEIRAAAATLPAPSLPAAADLWRTWTDLRAEAARQRRGIWEVSSLIGLGALTRLGRSAALATRRTGEVFAGALLGHYRDAIVDIHKRGYARYVATEFRPYLQGAALRFSPREKSLTEKLLRRSAPALLMCVLLPCVIAQQAPPIRGTPPPRSRPAPAVRSGVAPRISVSPRVLESHVSFLASDAMQGRATPSRELSLAAEYIAAQFRRIGLQTPPSGDYLQATEAEFVLSAAGRTVEVPVNSIRNLPDAPFDVPVAKVADAAAPRVRAAVFTTADIAAALQPRPRMVLALTEPNMPAVEQAITIADSGARAVWDAMEAGRIGGNAFYVPAGLHNVAGVLPGTDPALRDQYVLVTAHYDHVGLETAPSAADRIFNGANDNASGVAGMIEAAAALANSAAKPRRSIVFLAVFGEERGLLGTTYYARHPLFPLDRTVAMINLEQLGRTDDLQQKRVSAIGVTGFDFSEAGAMLRDAAAIEGVAVENPPDSDDYFNRSDNIVLANRGIPAHTVAVAFQFPDYHKVSDEWRKLDYANMAKVTEAVAAGALAIANRTEPPRWLATNPKAEPYRSAATALAQPREAPAERPARAKPRRAKPAPRLRF